MADYIQGDDDYNPEVEVYNSQDYYAFGMVMPGRSYTFTGNSSLNKYRFGFNGKENDDEVEGQQDYGFRIYDKRLGRFKSVDPLHSIYSELSPFQFASNTPIMAIDLDGLEAEVRITHKHYGEVYFAGTVDGKDVYKRNFTISQPITYLPGFPEYEVYSDKKAFGTRGTLNLIVVTSNRGGGLVEDAYGTFDIGWVDGLLNDILKSGHNEFGFVMMAKYGQGGETKTSNKYQIIEVNEFMNLLEVNDAMKLLNALSPNKYTDELLQIYDIVNSRLELTQHGISIGQLYQEQTKKPDIIYNRCEVCRKLENIKTGEIRPADDSIYIPKSQINEVKYEEFNHPK